MPLNKSKYFKATSRLCATAGSSCCKDSSLEEVSCKMTFHSLAVRWRSCSDILWTAAVCCGATLARARESKSPTGAT
eukprot:1468069-Amphidinium_carterae.1